MNAKLTKGNTDDRFVTPQMTADITEFLFANKGYISSELFLRLLARGLKLITGIKSNMENALMIFEEKLLLRKHSKHRSFINMLITYNFYSNRLSTQAV